MSLRLLTPASLLLCCLALATIVIAGLSQDIGFTDPSLVPTLALTLAKLAWLCHWPYLARSIATVTLACLTLGLLSYLLPEYWVTTSHWQTIAAWLQPGANLEDWRAPLHATLCLMLLGGAQLTGRRAALGSPMLIGLALLMWLAQLDVGLMPTTQWVVDYAADPAALMAMGCLLAAHAVRLVSTLIAERQLLIRPMSMALLLGCLALAFSQHLQYLEDRRLHDVLKQENHRLADHLSGEIGDHLSAMRRFVNGWRLMESPPDVDSWALMAEPLYRDFGYFVNIALVEPGSRIRYVYPMDAANRRLLGIKLSESQPAGRAAQRRALIDHQEAITDVIPLLQGQYGIIYYLPTRIATGRFIGASAMVLSLQALTDTLTEAIDTRRTRLELRQGTKSLAILGPDDGNRAWANTAQIHIGDHPLTLTTQPSRLRLLEYHARLPAVSLTTGLGLAYLLFLVLFSHRHLAIQHSLLHDSHAQLRLEIEARGRLQQEIEWLARHDELTNLANRRMLMETLKAQHNARPLCVMICDLDHFKRINDSLGHLTGDEYLKRLGALGEAVATQAGGLFARYGGEEFILLLPGCDTARGLQVAEELKASLQSADLKHHDGAALTMSIGLTALERGPLDIATLMQVADMALYQAKEQGRNRIVRAPMPS
ncbi:MULTISPECIES: GGDEF domain-containing protein [Halomonadaceae]|uniref:GGDEF domain-containing protein n=1 Tax=Halomonadaceae TaxID=28256 RepID=UPI00158220A0|nr:MULTISPECIES: sensor domain-containing diguanylate cyclase [Halomonas]MDI4637128.1 sensor domain-containing diguanylate cyclase [Halomonas sp. BMC7]NUJ58295.1 sensor domain-containing diguanylate cyclase [Halomonas taeanensis]